MTGFIYPARRNWDRTKRTLWGTLALALIMSGAMLSLWAPSPLAKSGLAIPDLSCTPGAPVAQYRTVGYYRVSPCSIVK